MTVVITQRQRRTTIGFLTMALVAVAAFALGIGRSNDSTTSADAELLPNAQFALFESGDASFDDFAGTPLVINFWASWCPACVAELPEFQEAHEEFGDQVTFLGVANADQRDAALDLAGDVGLTYQLADDPRGDVFRELGLFAMPTTLFVTAEGEVLEVFAGQLTGSALADRINELIAAS